MSIVFSILEAFEIFWLAFFSSAQYTSKQMVFAATILYNMRTRTENNSTLYQRVNFAHDFAFVVAN